MQLSEGRRGMLPPLIMLEPRLGDVCKLDPGSMAARGMGGVSCLWNIERLLERLSMDSLGSRPDASIMDDARPPTPSTPY